MKNEEEVYVDYNEKKVTAKFLYEQNGLTHAMLFSQIFSLYSDN